MGKPRDGKKVAMKSHYLTVGQRGPSPLDRPGMTWRTLFNDLIENGPTMHGKPQQRQKRAH